MYSRSPRANIASILVWLPSNADDFVTERWDTGVILLPPLQPGNGGSRLFSQQHNKIRLLRPQKMKQCLLYSPNNHSLSPQILLLLFRMGQIYYLSVNSVWRQVLGFVLLATPMMCIPVFMLIALSRVSSSRCSVFALSPFAGLISPPSDQGTQNMTTPSSDLRQARPQRPALTLCKRVICAGRVQPENHDRPEVITM